MKTYLHHQRTNAGHLSHLECIMLREISQTEKDKVDDITYMWNQNKYNKLVNITNIEDKLVVTSGEREGGGAI